MSITATATSQIPVVRQLVSELSASGKLLEKAYLDDKGSIIAYKPVNESLIITVRRGNDILNNQGVMGDSPATGLQQWFNDQQLLQYAQVPTQSNRLLYFGMGLAVLVMATLYIRRKK